MKITLLFVIIFSGYAGRTQNFQFFVEPTMNWKASVQLLEDNPFAPNFIGASKHLNVKARRMFLFPSLHLGANAGIKYKKNHIFKIGINSDEAGSEVFISAINGSYTEDGNFSLGNSVSGAHVFYHIRFNLTYENVFFTSKKGRISYRYTSGISLNFQRFTNPRQGFIHEYTDNLFPSSAVLPDGGINLSNEVTIKSLSRWAPAIQFGLGCDLNTKKGVNLFSVDIYYVQGTSIFTRSDYIFHVLEPINDVNYFYRLGLVSRASGLYLQFSRKFNIYPWRPNRKPKEIVG